MRARVVLMASVALNALFVVAGVYLFATRHTSADVGASNVAGSVVTKSNTGKTEVSAFPYWLPHYVAAAKARLLEHDMRAGGASGPSAATRLRYSFLPDDKLLQIEKIFLQADERRAQALESGSGLNIGAIEQDIVKDVDQAVVALLSASELLEFRMRDSALSEQLRATEFIFTEPEFRAVFTKLAGENGVGLTAVGDRRMRLDAENLKHIQEALSTERAHEFLRHQDPAYRALAQVAASQSLSASKVDAAYDAIKQWRESTTKAGLAFGPMDRRLAEQVRQINSARDQTLREILGDAEARKLAAVLNALSMRNSLSVSARGR